jgi:hypothetical protein
MKVQTEFRVASIGGCYEHGNETKGSRESEALPEELSDY